MSLTEKKNVVVEFMHIPGASSSEELVEMEALEEPGKERSRLEWYTLDARVSLSMERALARELRKELRQREARWAARDRVWPT
tara:strand:+ start:371 stop:619 length:249 start_codon:yes stop_codon:yes gene_type:complete